MKKYQLKINYENELTIVYESDNFMDIMKYIRRINLHTDWYSVWVDGKVLD